MRGVLCALAVTIAVASSAGLASAAAVPTAKHVDPTVDPSLAAVEGLLTSVPSDAREACYQIDTATAFASAYSDATAGVECDAPAQGVDRVVYLQYPDAATMNAAAGAEKPVGLGAADLNAPDSCSGTATWSYHDGGAGGSDACFSTTVDTRTFANIVWTADTPTIFGIATSFTDDGPAVKKWWNSSSGPLETPDDVTNFASSDQKVSAAASKSLVRGAGKAATGCQSTIGLVAPGDLEWPWLAWMAAAEKCAVPQHGALYLAKLNRGSVSAFEAYLHQYLTDTSTTKHPAACKTPRDVLDSHNKKVGRLECWYQGDTLYAGWYATDTDVVGAVTVNTTPQKIFDYLDKYKLL